MNAEKKEIKRILSGIIVDNGKYISASPNVLSNFRGTFSGASSIGFAGVTHRKRKYILSMDEEEGSDICWNALISLGRAVVLESAPEAYAAIRIPVFRNPTLMAAFVRGNELEFNIYTARTLFSFITALSGIRKFKKTLPEGTIVSESKKKTKEKELAKAKEKEPAEAKEEPHDSENDN